MAAVSLSGIEQRFSPNRLPALVDGIVAVGEELSRRLGYATTRDRRDHRRSGERGYL